jgi:hypothetical protein
MLYSLWYFLSAALLHSGVQYRRPNFGTNVFPHHSQTRSSCLSLFRFSRLDARKQSLEQYSCALPVGE